MRRVVAAALFLSVVSSAAFVYASTRVGPNGMGGPDDAVPHPLNSMIGPAGGGPNEPLPIPPVPKRLSNRA